RPKPPVRPKPRVLPKPAVPAKPSLPHPPTGPRHPRPELPSAEKMNRLAGPQPYSGGSVGGPLRRPSFTLKSPETPNGKGLPSPLVAAAEDLGSTPGEEVPPAPPTPPRKGPAPFKVTPVPVASKPERFPGTTVEEILAKMDSREGPGSPDRARLSPFCPDPSSRFGSKTFTAFRRRPSGEADGAPSGEVCQTPQPAVGELGTGDDGRPIAEMSGWFGASAGGGRGGQRRAGGIYPPSPFLSVSGSPPAGPSCAGDPRGRQRPPSPPDVSSRLALPCRGSSAPGLSPSGLSCLLRGSLSAGCVSLLSLWGTDRPFLRGSWVPPGRGARLFWRGWCVPAPLPRRPPSPPPESPAKASRPPGSPEGPDDSPVSSQASEGPDFSPPPPSRDSGLRRSSEGVLQPPATGQGMGELGGSLSALPRPRDLLSEPSLGSESGWSLSQSFEWTFPSRGARRLASPPRSPIREMADSGLSEEGESDGEDPAPCPPCSQGDGRSKGPSPVVASGRGAEGAPCPGGPVAQQEAESSAEEEEEEGEAERDATMPHSSLCVMEPSRDPDEPKPPAQPSLLTEAAPPDLAPPDPATAADSAWAPAGDSPVGLQGPGGPGQAEGSSRGPDPHADPGWLTELLASPRAHATGHGSPDTEGPEDLLGWSRKDLCSEFGIGRPHQASTFDWTYFGANKPKWGTGYGLDGAGSGEEIGKADWSSSYGVGRGQQQDEEPCSRQPSWAGRYSSGDPGSQDGEITPVWAGEYGTSDVEMKDREPIPDWASEYSSRDAETKEKDFTLGWAGRSSTGDTGTPDKELSPSRPAWDSKYSTRDMESQDREFSPSRPAWTGEYSARDMESQDREFSPSRPAWDSEYRSRDVESQDREFSPSRPAWDEEHSTRDVETRDRDFKPSRPAWASEYSSREMETQDSGFKPSRPAWDDGYSPRDVESQDREFSPSRPAWASEYGSANTEKEEREFSPGRLSWAGERSIGQTELVDAFGVRKDDLPGSCAPDPPAQEPGWGSTNRQECGATDSRDWAEELGGAERHNQFGIIGTERVPDASSTGASPDGSMSWAGGMRSGGLQEPLGDWHRDLSFRSSDATSCVVTGGASTVGPGQTAWDQGPGSLPALGGSAQPQEAGAEEPAWSRDVDAAGWSVELCDAEATRQEWASAFGARCAARSRDFGAGEQSQEGDTSSADSWPESPRSLAASLPSPDPKFCPSLWEGALGELPRGAATPLGVTSWERGESPGPLGAVWTSGERPLALPVPQFPFEGGEGSRLFSPSRSIHLSDPSLPMGDVPTDPPAAESPRSEPPSPTEEERDLPELAAAPRSPRASPLLPEAAGGGWPDAESEEAPSDHLDGKRPPSWEEKQLFLGAPQPEGPVDHAGEEFTFLEDTELLDSSVYRSKANLGRKRRHRAPALRPGAASEGDSWMFRDSTEPRPAHPAASSDEEAVEEPKSRRVRASPSSKGVKVPLFPGLSTSALKAKLRGRNRSAEEGVLPGDSKAAPPKDPHVQRSKSCKIPSLSGKPLALPPKPEKSSG
ncbi:TB182 protein, partial [Cochlearius cochlearius]|nr:TB182 protein [Cochlearius cochlearius]